METWRTIGCVGAGIGAGPFLFVPGVLGAPPFVLGARLTCDVPEPGGRPGPGLETWGTPAAAAAAFFASSSLFLISLAIRSFSPRTSFNWALSWSVVSLNAAVIACASCIPSGLLSDYNGVE
jgi:hypothetical protein